MTEAGLDICLLSKMFPPGVGGAETYAYELARGLGARGHEVDMYTQYPLELDDGFDVHENVSVRRLTKARKALVTFETLYFSLSARRRVAFDEYDIIHGTLMPPSTIGLVGKRSVDDTPIVVTSHGTSIDETMAVDPQRLGDYLLKFAFYPLNAVLDAIAGRRADAIIAISDHVRDRLIDTYGFPPDRVSVIPHGVDTERFRPRDGHHPAVDPDALSLLYLGRLDPRKGIDLLLRSLQRSKYPDVELIVGGTGRHAARLQRLVTEAGITNQVRFLGHVPEAELPDLYSAADLVVLPSRYEGYGLVLLEAMACGTPVIGTDAGGIPQVIDDGETGFVVERDETALANAIDAVRAEPQRIQALGDAARAAAQRRDWMNQIPKVERLYRRCL